MITCHLHHPHRLVSLSSVLLLAACAWPLHAQAPRKTPSDVYHYLSWRSPFTANRHAEPPSIRNHAENLSITGITKFPDGYFVILADRDDPEKTIIIQPGVASPVEILDIFDESADIQLQIKYLGQTARIGFAPRSAPAPKPNTTLLNTSPKLPRLVTPLTSPR